LSDWSIYLTVLNMIGQFQMNEMLHDMNQEVSVSPIYFLINRRYNKYL
jgi:hypothetical protein